MTAKTAAPPAASKAGYRILLDAPAEAPALGYPDIAGALAGIVMESAPRFAIGIFGGWGSGKTTLMQAIEARLDEERAVAVRFSAWRYEKEEHLILPLLDTIRDALLVWGEGRPGHIQASRATARTIGRVMRAIVAGTSVKIGVPGAIDVSFEANKALEEGTRLSQARAETLVPRSSYHASFRALRHAFEEFAGPNADRRIVVFIDDLDRCLPGSALQVLESMKLFFDLDGFVFVVGLDRQVVEHVVGSKFPSNATQDAASTTDTRMLGENYIKKIFQVPYTLAPVGVGQLRGFLDAVYEEAALPAPQRLEFEQVVEPHLPFLVRDGSVNPREVKRYMNAYTITTKIDETLDRNAVLAVLTLEFRADWDNVESALLLNGDVFVDALRRAQDGEATAWDDIGLDPRPPDEFIEYTMAGRPGAALALVGNAERYFRNVGTGAGTRDPALLQLLPRIGALRRYLRTVTADQSSYAGWQGDDGLRQGDAELARLKSLLLKEYSSRSPLATSILGDIDRFNEALRVFWTAIEDPVGRSSTETAREALEQILSQISGRVLALYRSPTAAPPLQAALSSQNAPPPRRPPQSR